MSSNNKTLTQEEVKQARSRVTKLIDELNLRIVGCEDENKMLVLGLVAKENICLIGKPGTAKTYRVELLSKLLNAKFFKYLLTKFTDDLELFGVPDFKQLVREGIFSRKWSKIVEADIIFLDEVFKANSAILNALLTMMNENVIYDPYTGEAKKINAWTFIGASNEIPMDEELQAFYDRFGIKIFVRPLEEDSLVLKALEAYWIHSTDNISPIASMNDIKVLHMYARQILASTIEKVGKFLTFYHSNAYPIVKSLKSEGIDVTPRTYIRKIAMLSASYCALFGLTLENLTNSILEVLPYVGKTPEEQDKIRRRILDELGEVRELAEKLEQAKVEELRGNLGKAKEILEEIVSFDLTKIAEKPFARKRAETIIKEARLRLTKIVETIESIRRSREISVEEVLE